MTDFPFLQDEKNNPYARSWRSEAMLAKPIDWIVDEFVSSGSLNLFCGAPKSGKTYFLMELGLSVATGTKYLGLETKRRLPVYYCFLEDSPAVVRNRFKSLSTLDRLTTNDQFMGLCDYGLESVQRGLNFLREEQGLLLIDPIGELCAEKRLDENKAPDVLNLLRNYRDLSHSVTGAIYMSHHFNKGGERMRGSTAFEAGIDGWTNLFTPKGRSSTLVLDWTQRMGKGGKLACERVYENGKMVFNILELAKKPNGSNGHAYVIDDTDDGTDGHFANKIEAFLKSSPKSKSDLTKHFRNGKRAKDIEEAIELLKDTKRIIEEKSDSGAIVYTTV